MNLNQANRITILRILLIVPFVLFMLKDEHPVVGTYMRYAALLIFLVMAFSDAYDGYIARKKKEVTPLGAFLDPMADKLLMACTCVLLSVNNTAVFGFRLPPTVAVLIIAKDLFLLIGFVILRFLNFEAKPTPALIGRIATALQLSMVAAILIAPEMSSVITGWIWFLRFLWWSAAGTAIVTTLIYIRVGTQYIEEL
ncbi:MAG: CDP-alcohol phosphatidyltransferase family protein [Sedimentisphaerales bacterium]